MKNDGGAGEERNREITELLQHTNRKHVTTSTIKTAAGSNVALRECLRVVKVKSYNDDAELKAVKEVHSRNL